MSIYSLSACIFTENIFFSVKRCCRLHPNFEKLQQSSLQFPHKSIKTSAWKQSRWPGKVNVVNTGNVYQDAYAVGRLWKPFVFTIVVSGLSVGGAAIWQYENVRYQATQKHRLWEAPKRKYGQFRQHVHTIWTRMSDGDKVFVPICALNLLVFLAWKVPRWQPIMSKYFSSGLQTNNLCWPMLLSTFSHFSVLHLGANMFVLHSFSDKAVNVLGKEQFLGMYLSAGMVSSFTSYLYKALIKCPNTSLGASGAVMGVLGYFCMKYPDSRLAIIFLPDFSFPASAGLKALIGFDTLGCLLQWRVFDHAAHLGGSLLGVFWFNWGHDYIWRKREPLISAWHQLRGPVK